MDIVNAKEKPIDPKPTINDIVSVVLKHNGGVVVITPDGKWSSCDNVGHNYLPYSLRYDPVAKTPFLKITYGWRECDTLCNPNLLELISNLVGRRKDYLPCASELELVFKDVAQFSEYVFTGIRGTLPVKIFQEA